MKEIIVITKEQLSELIGNKIQEHLEPIIEHIKEEERPRQWLTVAQKAKQLNVSTSMVYKLLNQGRLETKKIGRKRLIKTGVCQ